MNITGPIQTNLPQIQEKPDQFLKVNQRIAGEILNLSNDQVVLAVNGVQIVAKMTSAEQLASLMEKRYAYFIVKDVNENQITLQLAPSPSSTEAKQTVVANSLGQALLEQLQLPINDENVKIVQAMLNRGMEISQKSVNEIKQVLDAKPGWGTKEVNLTTAIKSAGLPLTEESLSMAMNTVKDIHTSFLSLYSQLSQALYRPGNQPNVNQLIRSSFEALQNALIQGGDSKENVEKSLQNAIKGLGTSLENEIAKLIEPGNREGQSSRLNNILFNLATLRHELGNSNARQLASAIDNFISGMRWIHFLNVEPEQQISKGQWTQFNLPISFGNQISNPQQNPVYNMKIRVAHDSDKNNISKINPDYTRLVIQVDLDDDESIKVDLSIVSQMVGAEITATNEDICSCASEELDDFKTGLSNLGYTLKTSKIELGSSFLEMDLNETGKSLPKITSIDLGV